MAISEKEYRQTLVAMGQELLTPSLPSAEKAYLKETSDKITKR